MAAPGMTRARVVLWLRIIVSLALIAVLVRKAPDLGDAFPSGFGRRAIALLALAVVIAFIGVVLSAWRWQRVIALFREPPSVAHLTVHYLAGLFVGNVLPSTIGGDVLRVSRASEEMGGEVAFASVALERLTGFIALPLLVVAGIILDPSLLSADHAWLSLLIASVSLALLATILYLAGHRRVAGRYVDRTNWLRFVGAVHVGVAAARRSPRHAVEILGTALAYQVSVVASVMVIAAALDLKVPEAGLLAFVPAVAMVQVVPVSLNGLGVREGMLVLLLHPIGATRGQAIALGLLWAGSMLVVSALGAPAFAAHHPTHASTPPTPDDVDRKIES